MDAATILTEIKSYGFSDYSDTEIIRAVNDTYYDVLSREPWPFLEKTDAVTLTAGTGDLTGVAADIGKVLSFTIITVGKEKTLAPERVDAISKQFPKDPPVQEPIFYYFVGNTIHVWPKPDMDYAGQIIYIALSNTLTASSSEANILLPLQHHMILVLGSIARLYMKEDNTDGQAVAREEFEYRYQNMRSDLWMRQYDRPDYIEITDPEDWWS